MVDAQTPTLIALLSLLMFAAYKRFASRLGGSESRATGKQDPRYLELFEHSTEAIFVIEVLQPGFRFESLNPAAQSMLSPSGSALVGRHFDELRRNMPDSLLATLLQNMSVHIERALKSALPAKYREEFLTGESYDIQLVPMVDDSGLSHFLCFARDITAQLRYERELQRRAGLEERLSGFVSSAPGFFYTFQHGRDGSNRMPFASEGIEELFGLRPERVAANIADLSMLIHPDDLGLFFESIARSAVDLKRHSVEFRVCHPQRGEIWVESLATPVAKEDGSVEWNGFMHDICKRKSMEHALRRNQLGLAEAQRIGQMGSWELDIASGDLAWSDQIFRIFEIDPGVFGASYEAFLNAIHPDDRDAVNRAYRESLDNRTPYCIDHRLQFPDGRVKHVRECCETHYDEAGNPVYSHGTVQDITAIKEAELRLKETQNKLRELVINGEKVREGERKRMAWEMHEEFGQILAAIKMNLSGMRGRMPEQQLAEQKLREINMLVDRSIRIMHTIVSDLRPTVLMHGIVAGLEWLVEEYDKHAGLACSLVIQAEHGEMPDEELTTLLFRLAEEALEDAIRHPGVSVVTLEWRCDTEKIALTIRHNGDSRSLDLSGHHSLRLFGMQERILASGGQMRVHSEAGSQTAIQIVFEREYIPGAAALV